MLVPFSEALSVVLRGRAEITRTFEVGLLNSVGLLLYGST